LKFNLPRIRSPIESYLNFKIPLRTIIENLLDMKVPEWMVVKEEIMAGYRWRNIFAVLWENKFRVHPKYWLRLAYVFALSLVTIPWRIVQRFKVRKIKKTIAVDKSPLFVIGNYRTGTTYLQTILSKDKTKGYVSNLIGYAFSMFLGMPKLSRKIIDASLPETRPMDNVIMGADEPTEDEYCLGTFSKYGYYHGFVFPRNFQKVYAKYHSFEGLPKDAEKWKKQYMELLQILTHVYKGKILFLKNPELALRIKFILEMFPDAKFVFTYRNPYTLYASNIHYYRKVVPIYTLQKWKDEMLVEEVIEHYKEMIAMLDEGRKLIPPENYMEIKYEDFIKDPMPHIEKIYTKFGFDNWESAQPLFQAHVDSQKSYVVNKFDINEDVISLVNKKWGHIVEDSIKKFI